MALAGGSVKERTRIDTRTGICCIPYASRRNADCRIDSESIGGHVLGSMLAERAPKWGAWYLERQEIESWG